MPIPFLFIGLGAAASFGLGKTAKAGADQKKANRTNAEAKKIIEESSMAADHSREAAGKALTDLGIEKAYVLNHNMKRFVASIEKLHGFEMSDSKGMNELQNLKIDQQSMKDLKKMSSVAASLVSGVASGATMGAITAFGAYGGVMTFGAASTGTAIASLSGVAATNATLAFLGGGALSVGGLGVAGGSMVLGGLVAAPALAVMGIVLGAKASANLDTAYSNLSKAQEYEEEMAAARTMCAGIRMRATMFERLLLKLDIIMEPLVTEVEKIIEEAGTNPFEYTDHQKATIAQALALSDAIKALIDTPILTEDGALTKESEKVAKSQQDVVSQYI